MSNNTLNSLRKQLTFDFMLDFTVELTSEEVALLTLFENLDYSGFGTRLGRKEKVEPFRMMLLLIHGAMNSRKCLFIILRQLMQRRDSMQKHMRI